MAKKQQEEVELLLVEDDPADVELTVHALRNAQVNNRIEVLGDGALALDFIFCRGKFSHRSIERPPKVVLLDLKLPKVGGLEILKAVKGDRRTKVIPVVILTSSREEQDLVNGYHLGANSYIQKPVDFDKFRETVRQLGLYWLVVNEPSPPNVFVGHLKES